MYPLLFRTVLSRMAPESAHHTAMAVIRMLGVPPFSWAARALTRPAPELATTALGLSFDSLEDFETAIEQLRVDHGRARAHDESAAATTE